MICTFPSKMHLKRRKDFRAVYARKCSVADPCLVLYIAPNGLETTRLGLSVGRRFGRAVERNRVKRLLREAFRLSGIGISLPGYDVICIPKKGLRGLAEYERSLSSLLRRGIAKLAAKDH